MERKEKYKKALVPESVMRLAVNIPEKNSLDPINLSYVGGSLATSNSENGRILLYPKGEKLNRLGITILNETGIINDNFQAVPFEENSPKLKSGIILQVSSSIDGFCYVRQKKACHFVDFTDPQNIYHSRFIQGQEFKNISSSPYCPSDYIVIYEGGKFEFRNLEETEALWSLFKHEYQVPYGEIDLVLCAFGSHPQSILSLNEHYLYSFDMRLEGKQKSVLFSSFDSSCYLDEKLFSCKGCAVTPFQHVISSNYHLFVCDERYSKRPVLIYNHMLNGYPLYSASTSISDTQNSSDVIVILGTQDTNELGAFAIKAQHSTIQPISLSPPLHLSTPTDSADSLRLHCIPIDNSVIDRLSYPLIGISVVPHSSEGYTIFQLNSLGDLFYQDFVKCTSSVEKSHQVSMGCVLATPDKILPQLSKLKTVSGVDALEYSNESVEEINVDLTEAFSM